MSQAISTGKPKRNEGQNQFVNLVVAPNLGAAHRSLDLPSEVDRPEIAIKKLKPREARQLLIRELDLKICIDSRMDFAIS
jgi:hypothetical protein